MILLQQKQLHLITGPAGDIELRLHTHQPSEAGQATSELHSTGAKPIKKGLVVISHPHPLFGGTMNNKVVTTMEKAFFNLGFDSVAYNFRGVGKSHGSYDEGVGETEDLLSVLSWQRQQADYQQVLLAGFSFGSYVSLKALQADELSEDLASICLVAPPVGLYDFTQFQTVQKNWVVIQGGADEVVDAKEVMAWIRTQQQAPDVYWRDKASHFFHGELIWLRKIIEAHYS